MKKRKIEKEVWVGDYLVDKKARSNSYLDFSFNPVQTHIHEHKAKIIIEVEEESLTFERIKKECVPMETIFFDPRTGSYFLYLGFNRNGELITDCHNGGSCVDWEESNIEDWSIRDE